MHSDSTEQTTIKAFVKSIRSDHLAELRRFAEQVPAFRKLGLPVQVRLVLDANIVFEDLRWLAGRRRNSEARTHLQELIDSKTIIGFAPAYLDQEVRAHAEEMAAQVGVQVVQYLSAWEEYKQKLIFISPRRVEITSEIDPKDIAYIQVYEEIGAHAVLTKDIHISRMGAKVVSTEVVTSLFFYARAASCYYSLYFGGTIVTVVSWELFLGILRASLGLWELLRSAPTWLKVSMIAAFIGAIAFPTSRNWLLKVAKEAVEASKDAVHTTGQVLAQVGAEAMLQTRVAERSIIPISAHLAPRRIPLKSYLRAVCLMESRPLTIVELAEKVQTKGYTTRNQRFHDYVRQILRMSSLFQETSGKWTTVA